MAGIKINYVIKFKVNGQVMSSNYSCYSKQEAIDSILRSYRQAEIISCEER